MNKSERAIAVKKILDKTYPDTPVQLHHKDNFSLLVAVLLSAQCTDERVNQVTPTLFKKANSAIKMTKVPKKTIYNIDGGQASVQIPTAAPFGLRVVNLISTVVNSICLNPLSKKRGQKNGVKKTG